jgi:hypothetical protein
MVEESNIVDKNSQIATLERQPLTQKQFMERICTGSDGKLIPKIHIYGKAEEREDLMDDVPEGVKVVTMYSVVHGVRDSKRALP